MNTLKILKGRDINLSVNSQPLSFVTEFSATEKSTTYPIKEMLSDEVVDHIIRDKKYKITLTALSLFDFSVFDSEPFSIVVSSDNVCYTYGGCRLLGVTHDVKAEKPITDRYEIEAQSLKLREVCYEQD